jgi:hypothetical protein
MCQAVEEGEVVEGGAVGDEDVVVVGGVLLDLAVAGTFKAGAGDVGAVEEDAGEGGDEAAREVLVEQKSHAESARRVRVGPRRRERHRRKDPSGPPDCG